MFLLHSASLPHYGINRIFDFAHQAGFDGMEIEVSINFDTQDVEYLRALEQKYQIPIRAFSLHEKYEETHTKAFQNVVKYFPHSTMNITSPELVSQNYKSWVDRISKILAEKYELKLCRRNTPFRSVFGIIPSRSENSLFSLKEAGNVCFDLTALALSNEDIMRAIDLLGSSMQHIYLSNVHHSDPYSLPMEGILPIESFLRKLAQSNFAGSFALRVKPSALCEGDNEKILERLQSCVKFFRENFIITPQASIPPVAQENVPMAQNPVVSTPVV